MAEMHLSDGIGIDADGFYVFKCTCGWHQWGLINMEAAVDFAMEHAAEMALNDE